MLSYVSCIGVHRSLYWMPWLDEVSVSVFSDSIYHFAFHLLYTICICCKLTNLVRSPCIPNDNDTVSSAFPFFSYDLLLRKKQQNNKTKQLQGFCHFLPLLSSALKTTFEGCSSSTHSLRKTPLIVIVVF